MVLRLIQSILPPSRINDKKDKSKIKKFYTVNESRESFIIICPTEVAYKEQYDARISKYSSIPPYISIIGTLTNPSTIMCDFENITYKFYSLTKAVDICFKAYWVFNMEYPEACAPMWQFINRQFYHLKYKNEKQNPITEMLFKEIKGTHIFLRYYYTAKSAFDQ